MSHINFLYFRWASVRPPLRSVFFLRPVFFLIRRQRKRGLEFMNVFVSVLFLSTFLWVHFYSNFFFLYFLVLAILVLILLVYFIFIFLFFSFFLFVVFPRFYVLISSFLWCYLSFLSFLFFFLFLLYSSIQYYYLLHFHCSFLNIFNVSLFFS